MFCTSSMFFAKKYARAEIYIFFKISNENKLTSQWYVNASNIIVNQISISEWKSRGSKETN